MIVRAELLTEQRLEQLLDEADQLCKIVAQSVNTAKDNQEKKREP